MVTFKIHKKFKDNGILRYHRIEDYNRRDYFSQLRYNFSSTKYFDHVILRREDFYRDIE